MKIDNAFWITGRGAVITVPEDDNYQVNQQVKLYKEGSSESIIGTIVGIEYAEGLNNKKFPSRGLQIRGITKSDIETGKIEAGMIIEKYEQPLSRIGETIIQIISRYTNIEISRGASLSAHNLDYVDFLHILDDIEDEFGYFLDKVCNYDPEELTINDFITKIEEVIK